MQDHWRRGNGIVPDALRREAQCLCSHLGRKGEVHLPFGKGRFPHVKGDSELDGHCRAKNALLFQDARKIFGREDGNGLRCRGGGLRGGRFWIIWWRWWLNHNDLFCQGVGSLLCHLDLSIKGGQGSLEFVSEYLLVGSFSGGLSIDQPEPRSVNKILWR